LFFKIYFVDIIGSVLASFECYFSLDPKVGLIFSNDESHYESEKQSGFINLFIINQYLQGVMNA
jgi:hypothetical protein